MIQDLHIRQKLNLICPEDLIKEMKIQAVREKYAFSEIVEDLCRKYLKTPMAGVRTNLQRPQKPLRRRAAADVALAEDQEQRLQTTGEGGVCTSNALKRSSLPAYGLRRTDKRAGAFPVRFALENHTVRFRPGQ